MTSLKIYIHNPNRILCIEEGEQWIMRIDYALTIWSNNN